MIIFKSQKISPRTTRITAPGLEMMYLIEGKERACLIDTGSGIGHLRAYVETLTDKPVTVLLTHGHVDHAMGAGEFDEVYMDHTDDYIYARHADMEFRRDGFFLCEQKDTMEESDIIPALPLEAIRDMKPGDVFDFGDFHVEIYGCPGHTKGSVVMLIPEEDALLLGDACNYRTFLHEDYCTTIAQYEESLKALKPLVEERYHRVWLSHGGGDGDVRLIDGVITLCEDIKAGNTDDVPFGFKDSIGFWAKREVAPDVRADGGIGNIIYSKERVW